MGGPCIAVLKKPKVLRLSNKPHTLNHLGKLVGFVAGGVIKDKHLVVHTLCVLKNGLKTAVGEAPLVKHWNKNGTAWSLSLRKLKNILLLQWPFDRGKRMAAVP